MSKLTATQEAAYGAIRGALSCAVFFVLCCMIVYLWYGPAPTYITYPAVGVTEQN